MVTKFRLHILNVTVAKFKEAKFKFTKNLGLKGYKGQGQLQRSRVQRFKVAVVKGTN